MQACAGASVAVLALFLWWLSLVASATPKQDAADAERALRQRWWLPRLVSRYPAIVMPEPLAISLRRYAWGMFWPLGSLLVLVAAAKTIVAYQSTGTATPWSYAPLPIGAWAGALAVVGALRSDRCWELFPWRYRIMVATFLGLNVLGAIGLHIKLVTAVMALVLVFAQVALFAALTAEWPLTRLALIAGAFIVVGWINGGDPYRLQFPNMENIQPTAEAQAPSPPVPPVPAASAALAPLGGLQLQFNLPHFNAVLEQPQPETADMRKIEEKYKQELLELEKKNQAAQGKDADIRKAIGQVCREAAAKLNGWGRYANAATLFLAAFNSAGDPVDRAESDLAQLNTSFAYYKSAMRLMYGRALSNDLALKIVPMLRNFDTVAEDVRKLEAAMPTASAGDKLRPLIATCREALAEGWCLRGGYYVFLKDEVKAKADVDRAIQYGGNIATAYFAAWATQLSGYGAYENARDLLNHVITVDPALAVAYAMRALARSYLGDKDGALSDYAQAIRLEPANPLGVMWSTTLQTGDDRRQCRPPRRGYRRPGAVLRRGEGDRLGQSGGLDLGRCRCRAAAPGHPQEEP